MHHLINSIASESLTTHLLQCFFNNLLEFLVVEATLHSLHAEVKGCQFAWR
jgi:hypothetical protein